MKDLEELITNDGTLSLRSLIYKENFHSNIGALKETKNKFIKPSKLERFKNKSIKVLDICFGLGYNSAFLFKELLNQSTKKIFIVMSVLLKKQKINLLNHQNLNDSKTNQ